jgi:hypothetical protein
MQKQINKEKLYTFKLTLPEILNIASHLGAASDETNFDVLREYRNDTIYKNLNPVVDSILDKSYNHDFFPTFSKFYNKLEEINKEYEPEVNTVHFCIYKVNNNLYTSTLYNTEKEMIDVITRIYNYGVVEFIGTFTQEIKTIYK